MKKLTVAMLLLALLCSISAPPVRAAGTSYDTVTTLPDGSRIVYAEHEVISSQYITAYSSRKCGVVAANGKVLVEPVYQSISEPVEGRAMFFKAGEGYGYFDENWNVVIPAQYRTAKNFSEGLAAVSDEHWMIGYIDRSGNTVVPFQYTLGGKFTNGKAYVQITETGYNGKTFSRTGAINQQGVFVEPARFRFKETSFDVLMSENRIDINGTVYENDALSYPFINYQGCSYIPLTYGTCRALGFTCIWSETAGLVLSTKPSSSAPEMGGNTMEHGVYGEATLYDGKLTIDGKTYTASDLYYPLLFYRNVVYLPVLYREGMERLGIQYSYHLGAGNTTPGYMVFTRK